MDTPEEVIAKFSEMKIVGRTIKDIRTVDNCFFYQDNDFENVFEAILNDDDKALAKLKFPCAITIDEPLLIQFEDGDVLGIDFSWENLVRMELNTLHWNIQPEGTTYLHADKIFQPLLGKQIVDILTTSSLQPNTYMPDTYDLDLSQQSSYLQRISFHCMAKKQNWKHSIEHKLVIEPSWCDFCKVSLRRHSRTLSMPALRIRDVLGDEMMDKQLKFYWDNYVCSRT